MNLQALMEQVLGIEIKMPDVYYDTKSGYTYLSV